MVLMGGSYLFSRAALMAAFAVSVSLTCCLVSSLFILLVLSFGAVSAAAHVAPTMAVLPEYSAKKLLISHVALICYAALRRRVHGDCAVHIKCWGIGNMMDKQAKMLIAELHIVPGVEHERVPGVIDAFRWRKLAIGICASEKKKFLKILEQTDCFTFGIPVFHNHSINDRFIFISCDINPTRDHRSFDFD